MINIEVLDEKDRNKEITDYLAKEICNKSVVYDIAQRGLTQSSTEIYAQASYTEAMHEIAHWIACDPKYRDENNLGLPEEDVVPNEEQIKNDPLLKRMFEEESVALCITKYLFDKYSVEPNKKETLYVDYLYGEQKRTADRCGLSQYDVAKKAAELFEQYTANIG